MIVQAIPSPTAGLSQSLTERPPISISSNADFTPENGVTSGGGTPLNPYIIEGWEINAASADGIAVTGTDKPFIIRDVEIHSGGAFFSGVFLRSVTSASILAVRATGNVIGVRVWGSVNVSIVESDVSSNAREGIELASSTHSRIEGNELHFNGGTSVLLDRSEKVEILGNHLSGSAGGISLSESANTTILGNTFLANGVTVSGDIPSHYDSHQIGQDNLVNGNPVQYHGNCTDLQVDGVVLGQLIVVACSRVEISNLTVSGTDGGVQAAFVENLRLISSFVTGNIVGVAIYSSEDVALQDNFIGNNFIGAEFSSTSNTTISDNTLADNGLGGLILRSSSGVQVLHNDFYDNGEEFLFAPRQVYDSEGDLNAWDGGYPEGGNYWSDYTGSDQCSGPDQDACPDPDGIGDTPYSFTDGKDDYPLMEPYRGPNTRPRALFTASPSTGNISTVFTVDASDSFDAEDPTALLEVRWDWEDDGIWDTPWSAEKVAEHSYAMPGDWAITLQVRDTMFRANQTTRSVSVENVRPVAAFEVTPTSGSTWTDFTVDASSSYDLETPVAALEVRWDWEDDGLWDTSWSTNKTKDHRYSDAGDYVIRLQIRDANRRTAEATRLLHVDGSIVLAGALAATFAASVAIIVFAFRRMRRPAPEAQDEHNSERGA